MKYLRVLFFAAVAMFILAMSASAQAPYWEGSGNDISNKNSGKVNVLGALVLAEAGESATIMTHVNSTDLGIHSRNGVFRLFYNEQFEIRTTSTSTPGVLFRLKSTGDAWFFGTHPGDSSHRLGIGVTNPSSKLTVAGTVETTQGGFKFPDGTVQTTATGSNYLKALDGNPAHAVWVDNSGYVGVGTETPAAELDVRGTTRTEVLEITGADLAEPFEIVSPEEVRPGLVASIDPANPGALRISNGAYDRTVVGVISGAGGINPGIVMARDEIKDGNYPIAFTGRVYVYADSSNGSIVPGDLLTSSEVPGHVMRVTDFDRANGSILGKAMTGLEDDKGLVLMIVALQ